MNVLVGKFAFRCLLWNLDNQGLAVACVTVDGPVKANTDHPGELTVPANVGRLTGKVGRKHRQLNGDTAQKLSTHADTQSARTKSGCPL